LYCIEEITAFIRPACSYGRRRRAILGASSAVETFCRPKMGCFKEVEYMLCLWRRIIPKNFICVV
jgi:hypothetical protein